jgi:CheY-like chemotaxis protein
VSDRILCVDDDALVLASPQRVLRKDVAVDVALGGTAAERLLEENEPYAVVMSDMHMPSRLVRELRVGHVLRSDIRTSDGKLLLAAGHVISATVLERLAISARVNDITDLISVEEVIGHQPDGLIQLSQGADA